MSGPPGDAPPLPLAEYALVPPLRWFALAHAGKNNPTLGLHTGAGTFVARRYTSRCYRDPEAIAYEERLLTWLATRGLSFAVPVPLPTRGGALHTSATQGRAALIPALRGTPLARQEHDGTLLGAATGEIQAALRHHPATPRPGRPLCGALFRFPLPQRDPLTLTPDDLGLPNSAPHDALLGWWREEAARLRAFADGPYRELPRQLCHNDVTPNNVLAEAGCTTAVLDFEFATVAARALDFATGLRQLIRHWEPGNAWAMVRPFCHGYARWMTLTPAEIAALPHLLRLRGAITALWWLGNEPQDAAASPVPASIANLRRLAHWLDRNGAALVAMVGAELAR